MRNPRLTNSAIIFAGCLLLVGCGNAGIFSLNRSGKQALISKKCNQKYSTEDLVEKVMPSVVVISTKESRGSGFVIGHYKGKTQIMTNSHVLNGVKKSIVSWSDGNEDFATTLMDAGGSTNLTDLALIEIEGIEGSVLPFKKTETRIASDVLALGAPEGLDFSFTKGIISNLRDEGRIIQTDAALNPGNSGGPLIDNTGCVVGVNTFIFKDSEGLNFAISSDVAKRFANKYIPTIKVSERKSKNDKARKVLNKAENLLEFGGDSLKVILLSNLSLLKGEDANSYFTRGAAKSNLNENHSAIIDVKKALSLDRENIGYLAKLAELESLIGEYGKAADTYSKLIKLNPNKAIYYLQRSNAYMMKKYNTPFSQWDLIDELKKKALIDIKKAISLDQNEKIAYLQWGYLIQQSRDPETGKINVSSAIEKYNKAIDIDETFLLSYFLRAEAKLKLSDIFGSKIDYSIALKIDPKNTYAHYYLGQAYGKEGNTEKQIESYSKAIENFSDYTKINDPSLQMLEISIGYKPELNVIYSHRAMLRTSINDINGSIMDYSNAILTYPIVEHNYDYELLELHYSRRARLWRRAGKSNNVCSDIRKISALRSKQNKQLSEEHRKIFSYMCEEDSNSIYQ